MAVVSKAIKARMDQAAAKHRSGDLLEARRQFEAILKQAPGTAAARFQIASIDHALGDPARAAAGLAKVRKQAPGQPPVWQLSVLCVGASDDRDAIAALRKELDKAPLPDPVKAGLGRMMTNDRPANFGKAAKHDVDRLIQALVTGDTATSVPLAKRLGTANPGSAHLLNAWASAEFQAGNEAYALSLYRRAILLDPFSSAIRLSLGQTLLKMHEFGQALHHLRRADDLLPNTPLILASIADALLQDNSRFTKRPEAHAIARRAKKLAPDDPYARLIYARALSDQDRFDEARPIFEDLLEDPGAQSRAYKLLSEMELMAGKPERSTELLQAAIELSPEAVENYYSLSMATTFEVGDPQIDALRALVDRDDLDEIAKIPAFFSLGKAYEDTRAYDRVFTYLKRANDAMLDAYGFDMKAVTERFDHIRRIADGVDLAKVAASNPNTIDPILITGMPRSGTTLTERIMDSHSDVSAVGEVVWTTAALSGLLQASAEQTGSAAWLETALYKAGAAYASDAAQVVSPPHRVADKTILNHEFIGLLHAAMPRSRVIVLRRDPRDNILSIYKNRFQPNSVTFNTSLRHAAWYYARFLDYLAFWQEVLPGSLIELNYDHLTEAPETALKPVFDHVGLDWQDDVLSFHKKGAAVRTLSAAQVRKPIYRSSVRSWERYKDDLAPLIDALVEFGVPLPD